MYKYTTDELEEKERERERHSQSKWNCESHHHMRLESNKAGGGVATFCGPIEGCSRMRPIFFSILPIAY